MKIICINSEIGNEVDVAKLTETLSKLNFKKLDRYTTGSVLPGNYCHIGLEFMKSHDDKYIMDTEGLKSGIKNTEGSVQATIRPFGAKNYFVYVEEAGLDVLKKHYNKQIIPVSIGVERDGWNYVAISDMNGMVSDIISLAK